ncbi:hypothetical protein DQ04_02301030 [Trypanosoma grayi]|uniref:hypothetical protein n=1 Tax=Trypanosoma grayi TaxID=71804 RepID=UPI0004F4978D|nr:hypothetical protein DQ04_02301030 [Trypanosoma grayi]KEG11764.1 hypothetical protein DQ04_02301030 [Trypanosoma grayi]
MRSAGCEGEASYAGPLTPTDAPAAISTGTSVAPGSAALNRATSLTEWEPFSQEQVRTSLQKRLMARGAHALIRCTPCSCSHSSTYSLTLSNSYDVESFIEELVENRPTASSVTAKGTRTLCAKPLVSLLEDFNDSSVAPWIFARFNDVQQVLAEVVLEFNTRLASCQVRSVKEASMWRQHTCDLRAELRQHSLREADLLRRLTQLERKLRERDESHARQLQEERSRIEEAQRWRQQLESKQEENMNAAYQMLRDTLALERTSS